MRREFTQSVRVQILKRAMEPDGFGVICCESCHKPALRWQIDHRDPDAMQIDKSRRLTADDGWLLCLPCHKTKTVKDVGEIAKAKRVEARHLGVKKKPKPGRAPVAGLTEIARRFQK